MGIDWAVNAPLMVGSLTLVLAVLVLLCIPNGRWLAWARATAAAVGRGLRHHHVYEWALIALLWAIFVLIFMDGKWGSQYRFAGLEFERLSGIMIPFELSLKQDNQFATWNPTLAFGIPLLNNAFSYLYNPLYSVPVIWLGAAQGTKVSLALALLIAAWGAWLLARAFGLGALARITVALLYMGSGGLSGKMDAGHYQLFLSLTWFPWVMAGVWWTLHTERRRAVVLLTLSFALLFLSGNIYYTLHALVCAVVLALPFVWRRTLPFVQVARVRRLLIAAVLAVGLTGVQLIPTWQMREYVIHGDDPQLQGSYRDGLAASVPQFVFPYDGWRQMIIGVRNMDNGTLFPSVDYAYIGLAPFVLMLAAFVAVVFWRVPYDRPSVTYTALGLVLVLAALMMIWGAGYGEVLRWLYRNVPLLSEFRHVARANTIAALWWIVAAGFAVDYLWRAIQAKTEKIDLRRMVIVAVVIWVPVLAFVIWWYGFAFSHPLDVLLLCLVSMIALQVLWWFARAVLAASPMGRGGARVLFGRFAASMGQGALVLGCLLAVRDPFNVNAFMYKLTLAELDYTYLYDYLRVRDGTPFPLMIEPTMFASAYQNYYEQVRNVSLDEGWSVAAISNWRMSHTGVISDLTNNPAALPRWLLSFDAKENIMQFYQYRAQICRETPSALQVIDASQRCDVLHPLISMALYENPQALPYAFIVSETALTDPLLVRADKVGLVQSYEQSYAQLVVGAESPVLPNQAGTASEVFYLVIRETHAAGWRAWIDDLAVQPISIGQYIAIRMPANGTHTYTFRYHTPGIATGALVSVGAMLALGMYAFGRRRTSVTAAVAAPVHPNQ
jgi:hypothetical protein